MCVRAGVIGGGEGAGAWSTSMCDAGAGIGGASMYSGALSMGRLMCGFSPAISFLCAHLP